MYRPPRQPVHSPLADLEAAFRRASRGPTPLAVEGSEIGPDLPARAIPLDELRVLLLHTPVAYATKDRALGLVAARAQAGDDLWTVAFAGLLMPGLKRTARRLYRTQDVDRREVGPEIVAALLEALAHLDPGRDRIAASVLWEVYRRAYRALVPADLVLPLSELCEQPALRAGGPEDVLARAVRAGVVTADDAELIAATRLEDRRIIDLAASLGLPVARLKKQRWRAERRVVRLLHRESTGAVSDVHRNWWTLHGFPACPRATVVATGAGPWRPRPWKRRDALRLPPPELVFAAAQADASRSRAVERRAA